MKPLQISRAVFESRIGKRIFWMFICCSFIPILLLSTLTYVQVKRQLNDQAVARLRQLAKSVGMSIYERLELLESELRLVSPSLSENGMTATNHINLSRAHQDMPRFRGLTFVSDDGRKIALVGQSPRVAPFAAEEKTRLHAGQSIIRSIPQQSAMPRVQIGLRTVIGSGTAGMLVGEVNTAYLWGIGQQYNLPAATEMTILDDSGSVLVSSLDDITDLIRRSATPDRDSATRHFTWRTGEETYLACYWDLFLKSRFSAEHWTIVLSQTRTDALAIIRSFRFDFPLAMLLGFWVILLLSIRFIRKSLVPLEKLQEGTRRIHDGDFSQIVDVDSNDEFEDLAESFNLMMHRLARTFGELWVMAEMGRYGATRPEVQDLATTELQLLAGKLDFDWGLLMIKGQALSGDDLMAGFGMNASAPKGKPEMLSPDRHPEMAQLMTHFIAHRSPIFTNDTGELTAILPTDCMAFLDGLGCRSLICVPMMYETQYMGALAVGRLATDEPLLSNDQDLMVGIASHTAVIVNSIASFRRLEESETRFRQAFDHAATGVMLVSRDFKMLASNRYLQTMLGYTEAELTGKPLEDIIVTTDRAIGQDALSRLLTGQLVFTQFETRYQRKEGEAVWVRVNGSLMRDTRGKPLHFIFHIQDLSAEKTAEEDKQRLETQLRQAQKMEAIGTLAGGIAHDFNNILSAVGGYTELALLKLPEDSEIHDHLNKVKTATDRATDLVRRILAFSRQSEHEKTPTQISSIVEEALQLLRASMPATIEIRKIIDDASALVLADPTQIHQIVMNLCTNALHAMQDTGGTLNVRLEKVDLPLENDPGKYSMKPGPYIQFSVADTGCGMDGKTLDRIFDPYFTTKEKGKGTGLGLAVVHGIVESHGGTIDVTSSPGNGTTFTLYFPIMDQKAQRTNATSTMPSVGSEHVLFIDDEPMLVDIGQSMLQNMGYRVTGMTDPYAAIEAFRDNPAQFDIVITDLTMPGITGDRLAEELSALRQNIPILLCSGYVQNLGAHPSITGTIHKPITMQDLSRAVRSALDG